MLYYGCKSEGPSQTPRCNLFVRSVRNEATGSPLRRARGRTYGLTVPPRGCVASRHGGPRPRENLLGHPAFMTPSLCLAREEGRARNDKGRALREAFQYDLAITISSRMYRMPP